MSSVEENTQPQGWEIKEIQEIASPNHSYAVGDGDHGQIKSTWYKEEGIPYIRVGDILDDGSISFKKIVYISQKVHNDNKKSHLLPGDILIAKTGATIGKVAIIPESIPTSNTTASVGKITLNRLIADTKFIFYYLNSSDFKKDMWAVSHKSAQPGFNIKDLKCFKIPLPPLEEQKRIVAKIDTLFAKIDKAISLTEESLKQAKKLLPSVLKEVFEKGKADGWKEKKWDEVLEIKNGKSQKEFLVDEGGYPIYGSGGLMNGRVSKFLCPKNTTIVGRKGTIDKPKYIEEDFWNVDTAFGLCSKTGLNPRFLYYFCLTFNFRSLNKSTTLPSLTKRDLLQIKMPITTSENQMKVVSIADDILLKSQKTQSKLEKQLAYLKQLKSSILCKAFKGEL